MDPTLTADLPALDTIDAKTLSEKDIPAPRQLVKGLITEGLNILAGNPKSGKSFFSLGLALSLANGLPALGNIPIDKQTGVLYLALEDTHFRLKSRMKGLHKPPSPNLHFATSIPRMSDGGLILIDHFLQDNPNIGLVIIDTLAKISDPKTGANVYDEDAAMGSALHGLAHSRNAAILVVHHTRKLAHGDFLHTVSGSAGFTGTADTVMVLTRQRNAMNATLEVTGRDIHEAKFELQWLSAKGGWVQQDTDFRRYASGPTRRDLA